MSAVVWQCIQLNHEIICEIQTKTKDGRYTSVDKPASPAFKQHQSGPKPNDATSISPFPRRWVKQLRRLWSFPALLSSLRKIFDPSN